MPAKEKVTKVVKKGRNLLAVRGMNRESAAGLLIRLDIELADGRTQRVNTDATWLATGTQLPRGWQFTTYAPDPKDGWKKPFVIGKYGMQPWGDFAQASEGLEALAADQIKVPAGFKVERLYSVAREQGSWVSMTFDPRAGSSPTTSAARSAA